MSSSVDHSLLFLFVSAAAAAATSATSAAAATTNVLLLLLFLASLYFVSSILSWLHPGGAAWFRLSSFHHLRRRPPIPGPRGLPILGSLLSFATSATPHRLLSALAATSAQRRRLMALSLASTRLVVSSHPSTARSLLSSSAFSDRPLTQSARQLLFNRAIGFSPAGDRWRRLRRLAATHLFSPRRIAAHQPLRQLEADALLRHLAAATSQACTLRPALQHASLNSIMRTVFGKSYAFSSSSSSSSSPFSEEATEAVKLQRMVREGFELLGSFNMADHLPSAFDTVDPLRIRQRCEELVPHVFAFVQKIIDDHRAVRSAVDSAGDSSDFVDVLLKLQEEEGLTDADIVSVLWEMIFRGSDTMAILTEWILAELTRHPDVQEKLHAEIAAVGGGVTDTKMARMPYLQAVVKEGLRMHPPGPLLSWARLAVHDTEVDGYMVPAGTTAMVNMWAITHDPEIWENPERFEPERFVEGGEAAGVEVFGTDMRLAPFGAGVRSCPGKAMAMATVQLWVASIVERFRLTAAEDRGVDLTEVLKLSCEMAAPLTVRLELRRPVHVDS